MWDGKLFLPLFKQLMQPLPSKLPTTLSQCVSSRLVEHQTDVLKAVVLLLVPSLFPFFYFFLPHDLMASFIGHMS